jgi:FK506-binding nuclear protein
MHYVGRLKTNNKIFDSSKRPFAFRLGRGEVIKGWDIGCTGMKVGGKRTLTIPPEKGYGRSGAPPAIPPNATLVFDISLVSIK